MDEINQVTIGIDLGSTSTSIAFDVNGGDESEVQILNNWPAAMKWSYDQVPRGPEIATIVYYDPHATRSFGWTKDRFEVVTERDTLKPGLFAATNFISRLSPPGDYPDEWKSALLPGTKTPEDVTLDYLRHLRLNILQQIVDEGYSGEVARLHFVITVPAFWDTVTRNRFRQLATTAGFVRAESAGQTLSFISGLEAALSQSVYLHAGVPSSPDNILVLDCGGHTVEAAVYTVESSSPLMVERRTPVSVASCGSAEVTRLFMDIAKAKIDKVRVPSTGRAFRVMRVRAKRAFGREVLFNDKFNAVGFHFDIPPEIHADGKADTFWVADLGVELSCPEADMVEGYISFSREKICAPFNTIVERTMGLVRDQIGAVEVLGEQVNDCLLIGGFNKCPYYSGKVEAGMAAPGLRLVKPSDDGANLAMGAAWAAVSGSGPSK
ncbi:Hsp70 family protein [Aspergillus mulundensis]|uniref:Actin-like ATPase domain-containing protein n=1 Tax=Aspergillus mulundensis TaxID=1810919 RepID=A0A3D8R0J7_9EURO|nr:hypothetical protein DSM5745_09297 [Aspergillus mulundensis]RDW67431.1 hypothetical protein DSM5745_09297 [Aspergillus mulundensis]